MGVGGENVLTLGLGKIPHFSPKSWEGEEGVGGTSRC